MNKQIVLYRGIRKDNNEWVYGGIFVQEENDVKEYAVYILTSSLDYVCNAYEVYPNTVGQYTGEVDGSGNKIFDGDIIDASNEWWYAAGYAGHDEPFILVKWNQAECGFAPFSTYDSDCGVWMNAKGCKVIGNIYDNPEIKWCR